jgi:hypothetical protein
MLAPASRLASTDKDARNVRSALMISEHSIHSIVTLTQNKENALEGFETIPQFTHGMSFFLDRSQVEQNCSQNGPTHNKWVERNGGEAAKTKNTTIIEGFGKMPFVTLDVIFSAEREGHNVRLNDARNNEVTSAEDICKINTDVFAKHLAKEYYTSEPDDVDATNCQNSIFDHADCDELVHDDLSQVPQETFAYDLKERKQLKQIRTIDRQPIRKVKYEHGNQKSSTQPSVTHIPSWTKLFTSIGD